MNQSSVIFGFLAAAFLVFITQRGSLPLYWGFLVSTPKQPAAGPTASPDGKINTSDIIAIGKTAAQFAVIL